MKEISFLLLFTYLRQLKGPRIKLIIFPTFRNEILMIPTLNNPPLFQHHNHIGILHGREPVGNHKHGPARHQTVHTPLHNRFRPSINTGGRFIQNQNRRVRNGRPGNRQKLPLPLGQIRPVSGKRYPHRQASPHLSPPCPWHPAFHSEYCPPQCP